MDAIDGVPGNAPLHGSTKSPPRTIVVLSHRDILKSVVDTTKLEVQLHHDIGNEVFPKFPDLVEVLDQTDGLDSNDSVRDGFEIPVRNEIVLINHENDYTRTFVLCFFELRSEDGISS